MTTEPTDTARRCWLPFDRWIVGYCALMIVVLTLFGQEVGDRQWNIAVYAGVIMLVVTIVRWFPRENSRLSMAVRLLYPALLLTPFYRMTGDYMFLLFDGFLDTQLVQIEKAVFGVNPTLYVDRHLLHVWANEVIHFCYSSYYLMIPGFYLAMFLLRRDAIIVSAWTATMITFIASYSLFILYPIEGPRWHFAEVYEHAVKGPVFRQFVEMVMAKGAVRGGGMPSSHSGVAVVLMMYLLRHYRTAGLVFAVLVTGLAVGCVWGRFHYVSDVIVGITIAVIATVLVWRRMGTRYTDPPESA
ncbi:phosphatase PAP2 family protein [candidate division GN15 bacterium]|nr:phosphatase PAP2 family protein [candidate division GN15 bacterium]